MTRLAIWFKEMVTRILVAFKLKNTPVTMPEPSIMKSQRINEIMSLPEVQKLKNEMTIKQGNQFLDLVAIQYQTQDLTSGQRMILGMAMQTTQMQIQKAQQTLEIMN